MSTISTPTHRSFNMNIVVVLVLAFVTIFVLAVAPSVIAPKAAVVPAAGSENAYLDYLRGEKVMYLNPSALENALALYHAGEKEMYGNTQGLSDAIWAWHLGEKFIVQFDAREAAMLEYRRGEKSYK